MKTIYKKKPSADKLHYVTLYQQNRETDDEKTFISINKINK